MTTTENAAPERGECLADLFQRLKAQGADLDHLHAVAEQQRRSKNAEAARLARLYFGRPEGEAIRPIDFADRLDELSARAWGVERAVYTILEESDCAQNRGIVRLAVELATDLERIAEAFSAELSAARPEPYKPGSFIDALNRHEDALRAVDAHDGPEDVPQELVDAEDEALMALATLRCLPGAVPTKLRRLILNHKRAHGPMWRDAGAPEIMAALDLHFGSGWNGRTNAAAARADIGGILEEAGEPKALGDAETSALLEDPAIVEALDKIGVK